MTRSLTQKVTLGAFAFFSLITIAVIVAIWSLFAIRDAQHHLTEDVLNWSQASDTFSGHLNRAVAEAITFGYSGLDEDREEAQAALDAAWASLQALKEQAHHYAEAHDPAEYDELYQRQVDLLTTAQTHIDQLLNAGATSATTEEALEALEALEEEIANLTADADAALDANIDDSTNVVSIMIHVMFWIAGISFSVLGSMVALGLILLRRKVVQPIEALSTAADAVAGGDLAQNVSVTNNDQIGTLQRSFNLMVRSLRQQTHALQQERAALEQEIAQRRRVQEVLQESELRFRVLFESSPDGIFLTDPHATDVFWKIVDCNEAACRMNGYRREELIGQSLTLFEYQHQDPATYGPFLEQLRREGMVQLETLHRRKDGTLFRIETSVSLLNLGDHELVLGIDRDITERKQAEEALRISEMQQRALLGAIPDVMFRIRRDGTFVETKAPSNVELVMPVDAFSGKQLADVLAPDVASKALAAVQHTLDTNMLQGLEYQLPVGGTLLDLEARLVVSGTDEVLAIVRDITERKRLDRMKNEFISTVSHELRTPLTSIRGSLGLIAGGVAGELPARAKAMIDIAYNNSERLVRLINDILDMEKIESGKMVFSLKPLHLHTLIEQAIEANRAYGEQFRVTFALERSDPHVSVMADSDRLMQVLTNLLSNAAKFSPPDGMVHISMVQQSGMVRVSVTDHGPGIPETFRTRIFQKFAQADSSDTRQKGGTGLGLSITRAIVEKHGGHVGFDTATGVGTTFFFDLPVWQAPQLAVSDDRPQPADAARILICEDNRDIATLLSLVLDQGGFQTDIAYDAAQAKRLLEQQTYAGMTLDVLLPDQDGIALVRELRAQERTRELPILVVSAKTESNYQELNAEAFGIVDWLEKPIDTSRLMNAVQCTIGRLADSPCRILHVEDDPDVAQVISAVLQNVAEVIGAASLAEAKHRLARETFDLVLLDIGLPDGSGLDLIPLVTGSKLPVPVIIFSAQDVSNELSQQVSATLVKSRTNNQQFLDAVMALIKRHNAPIDVSVPTSEGT